MLSGRLRSSIAPIEPMHQQISLLFWDWHDQGKRSSALSPFLRKCQQFFRDHDPTLPHLNALAHGLVTLPPVNLLMIFPTVYDIFTSATLQAGFNPTNGTRTDWWHIQRNYDEVSSRLNFTDTADTLIRHKSLIITQLARFFHQIYYSGTIFPRVSHHRDTSCRSQINQTNGKALCSDISEATAQDNLGSCRKIYFKNLSQ